MSEQMSDELKDLIVRLVVKNFNHEGQRFLLFNRWKDSIEVEYPIFALEQFVTDILSHSTRPAGTEAETIERCAKVAEEIRHGWVNGEATTIYGKAYQQACAHIASAIRALTPQTTGEKDKL